MPLNKERNQTKPSNEKPSGQDVKLCACLNLNLKISFWLSYKSYKFGLVWFLCLMAYQPL